MSLREFGRKLRLAADLLSAARKERSEAFETTLLEVLDQAEPAAAPVELNVTADVEAVLRIADRIAQGETIESDLLPEFLSADLVTLAAEVRSLRGELAVFQAEEAIIVETPAVES